MTFVQSSPGSASLPFSPHQSTNWTLALWVFLRERPVYEDVSEKITMVECELGLHLPPRDECNLANEGRCRGILAAVHRTGRRERCFSPTTFRTRRTDILLAVALNYSFREQSESASANLAVQQNVSRRDGKQREGGEDGNNS